MDNIAYFTLKDRNEQPKMTVCFVEKEDQAAFGISICSKDDKFKYGKGRKLAFERTKAAIYLESYYFSENNYLMRQETYEAMHALKLKDYIRLTRLLNIGRSIYTCKGDVVDGISYNGLIKYFIGRKK